MHVSKPTARGDRRPPLDAFRHAGLAMAPFPKQFGGADLCEPGRYQDLCTILRLLGAGELSVARIFEGHVNAVSLVARYGSSNQMRAFSERIAMGGLSAVWGADDVKGLHVFDGQLQGRKILASGAGFVTDRRRPRMVKSCASYL
jgi:alkylation response protein AidB-like acyl-CoA dehydrogenase